MRTRVSITQKIFLVILGPALVLLFVLFLNYRSLDSLGRSAEQILSKNYRSIKAALQIRQGLEDNLNHIIASAGKDPLLARFRDMPLKDVAPYLHICRENITESGESETIAALYRTWSEYRTHLSLWRPATTTMGLETKPIPDLISVTAAMNAQINRLIAINEQAMEEAENKTRMTAARALRYSVALLVAAIGFSLGLSFLLARKISNPLTMLAQTLSEIKEGSGEYPLIPVTTKDEIGFLAAQFNRLFERLKVYDHRSATLLRSERMKVRQAEIAKARFIADLSHQLKTPMTSLAMGVGLLSEKGDRLSLEKRLRLLETIRDDSARLSTLINELVDIAKLESMVKTREKEVLDLERVVAETLRPLVHQAEEKGVALEVRFAAGIPPAAIDSLRFPWVFTNLVGNAIRYTDSGGTVRLTAETRGNQCHFSCADSGSGIAPEFVQKIFDRYAQFSEREKSGTIGLGLAIVKEILEQHGGDIAVESAPGRGTVFRFWIPLG